MTNTLTEFEIGVRHGEYLAKIILLLLTISGGGSVIFGVFKTCKTVSFIWKAVNFIAKRYKRVNSSPEQLLEDSINAINEAF